MFDPGRTIALVLGFLVTGTATYAGQAKLQVPLTGAVEVLEGDLLRVGGTRVRLYAIDAPELAQTCQGARRVYPCGAIARTGLMDLTAGVASLTCHVAGAEADGTVVARCLDPQGFDLSQQMIYTGWALALPDADASFHALQQKAQEAGRGLWKWQVERPWLWRQEMSNRPQKGQR